MLLHTRHNMNRVKKTGVGVGGLSHDRTTTIQGNDRDMWKEIRSV